MVIYTNDRMSDSQLLRTFANQAAPGSKAARAALLVATRIEQGKIRPEPINLKVKQNCWSSDNGTRTHYHALGCALDLHFYPKPFHAPASPTYCQSVTPSY